MTQSIEKLPPQNIEAEQSALGSLMIDKDAIPTKLLWIDLEMTGLDPVKDLILEVGVEITDLCL